MKHLFSSFTAVAFATMLTTPVFAHTHLTETIPTDGATVTEAPTELILKFDGPVGEGSFVELTNTTGQEISIPTIEISDFNMIATLAEPLPNDQYTVDWSIISADGHPLQGSYTFAVNAAVIENQVQVDEENVETTEETEAVVIAKNAKDKEEKSSNNSVFIIASVLGVIIIGSLFVLLKRKK